MCGRYGLSTPLDKLFKRYNISKNREFSFSPKKEIFPSQKAPIIKANKNNEFDIHNFKWGFSPSFASNLIINARGETVNKKPTFKNSFYKRRCLIPVTNFYEWKTVGNKKIKYEISLKNNDIFSLAGIYDNFKDDDGNKVTAFCIITISANQKMSDLHSRMPVIIPKNIEKKMVKY